MPRATFGSIKTARKSPRDSWYLGRITSVVDKSLVEDNCISADAEFERPTLLYHWPGPTEISRHLQEVNANIRLEEDPIQPVIPNLPATYERQKSVECSHFDLQGPRREMSDAELQEEEREVLLSIYDGDPAFKQLTPTVFQYKFGQDNDCKSFLLEISWGESYPSEKPSVNMNTFYNKHIVQEVKDKVIGHVEAEADQWLGCAMTYTLFQSVQENYADLIAAQPDSVTEMEAETNRLKIADDFPHQQGEESGKKAKKEHLTKAQKRRQWNKTNGKGERPRGWDWVDIVKHLSQTGPKQEQES